MDGRVVELYPLPYAYRARAENDDLFLLIVRGGRARLAVGVVSRVEIRRLRGELRGAGIDHVIGGVKRLLYLFAGDTLERGVGIAQALALAVPVVARLARGESGLVIGEIFELVREPRVDLRYLEYLLGGHALLERLEDAEDAQIVHIAQRLADIGVLVRGEFVVVERVGRQLRSADRLHDRSLEIRRYRHDLAGRLHLRAELARRADELVERPFRELDDDVVDRRLEARAGLARDVVAYLVERVAEGYLGRDLGYRVAGRL